MRILGISAFYHDAAAALVVDGELVAAAQEERFSRRKHDPAFPAAAARWCLDDAETRLEDLDAVVLYEKPLLAFERLLETWHATAPAGLAQFLRSAPAWMGRKLFFRTALARGLRGLDRGDPARVPVLFGEHHLSHAASAFYPSPFPEAAVLTLDGVGEWATASIAHGRGRELRTLRELRFPHSLGLFYSAVTQFLGFRVNSGEYKVMGLAPYGDPEGERTARFEAFVRERLLALGDDGALRLNAAFFRFTTGLEMIHRRRWSALFGFPARSPDGPLEGHHADLALAVQRVTEDVVLRLAAEARRLTGARHLCLAGGVALNCVANARLRDAGLFEGIWVQPAAGDAGGAAGAALAAFHLAFGGPRPPAGPGDRMRHALLGPSFTPAEIDAAAFRLGLRGRVLGGEGPAAREAARRLDEGQIGGWFQGRMEWGPRALGSRSIVADPRRPDMQRRLNLRTKFREGFRPFAPAVLEEDAPAWFQVAGPSPYMLFTAAVHPARRLPAAEARGAPWREQLAVLRSAIPAVTHVDGSARLQTVGRDHPTFRALLEAFRDRTGCPVLVNTSFNVRGEPIVRSPGDALRCFLRTDMDFLIMGDRLFEKTGAGGGAHGPGEGSLGVAAAAQGLVAPAAPPDAPPPRGAPGHGRILAPRTGDLYVLLTAGPPEPRRLEGVLSLTLALLAVSLLGSLPILVPVAAGVALAGLAAPRCSRVPVGLWLAATGLLGRGIAALLLALVWVLLVTPMGLLRRLLGAVPASFRRGGGPPPSLEVQDRAWGPEDLRNPW